MKLICDVRPRDNLDDRREIWHLLARLPPRRRYQFLAWCCRQTTAKPQPLPSWFRMTPRILAAERGDERQDMALTNEIYGDLWALGYQYGLSTALATLELERIVRLLR